MIHNELFQKQLSMVSPDVKKGMAWATDIVDKVDRLLKEKGMTQRELASKIGCNETQIVRWTRGFPNYTLTTLAKLSVALGEDLISIPTYGSMVSGYHSVYAQHQRYLSESESPSYGGQGEDSMKECSHAAATTAEIER